MNCPLCSREMREGYIPTTGIEWVPEQENPHLFYKKDKSNGFRLGGNAMFELKKQSAHFCTECNNIIIPCE